MPATAEAHELGRLKELTLVQVEGLWVIKGRAEAGLQKLFGAAYLPVIMSSQRIAELLMLKAREACDHKSVDVTFFTSKAILLDCWRAKVG